MPRRGHALFEVDAQSIRNAVDVVEEGDHLRSVVDRPIRQTDAPQSVDVALRTAPGEIVLEVRDDGRGVLESEISSPGALGITGMRERALAWGGEVSIAGRPGHGTTVTARLPLPTTSASEPAG